MKHYLPLPKSPKAHQLVNACRTQGLRVRLRGSLYASAHIEDWRKVLKIWEAPVPVMAGMFLREKANSFEHCGV